MKIAVSNCQMVNGDQRSKHWPTSPQGSHHEATRDLSINGKGKLPTFHYLISSECLTKSLSQMNLGRDQHLKHPQILGMKIHLEVS